MALVRVHELAKQLGVSSKDVLAKLQELGYFVKSASSTVSDEAVAALRDQVPRIPGPRPADEPKDDPERHRLGSAPSSAATAPEFPPAEKQPDDRWVIKATAKDGRTGYYGKGSWGNVGVVPTRGNSFRYDSQDDARFHAYEAKARGLFVDFAVEELPLKPRFKTPGVDLER